MRPDAVAVLDAFHVVKLGTAVVDEVRRRVQQDTLGRRGHKQDPPFKIRGLLRHGVEHLTARQVVRLEAGLEAGDPDWAVRVAWSCYRQLRAIYHARTPAQRARLAEQVIATFPTCPIPEIARLGRTLRAWRAQVLAYFDTDGVSDGGTEAINLIIDKTRRLAHGFRTFTHYRLRILLAASDNRPWRTRPRMDPTSPFPDHAPRAYSVCATYQLSFAMSASGADPNEHADLGGGPVFAMAEGTEMDTMQQVREGMLVVGPDGKKVGTVEDLKMGDPDAVTADGQTDPETDALSMGLIDRFVNQSTLPRYSAERLLRIGYVKIDRSGFLAGHTYLGSDELDRVEGDTLWLKAAKHKAARHTASS
jgi:hypothetical protein